MNLSQHYYCLPRGGSPGIRTQIPRLKRPVLYAIELETQERSVWSSRQPSCGTPVTADMTSEMPLGVEPSWCGVAIRCLTVQPRHQVSDSQPSRNVFPSSTYSSIPRSCLGVGLRWEAHGHSRTWEDSNLQPSPSEGDAHPLELQVQGTLGRSRTFILRLRTPLHFQSCFEGMRAIPENRTRPTRVQITFDPWSDGRHRLG